MDVFDAALQYLADKVGRGPQRGNSTTNKAAQFTSGPGLPTGTMSAFENSGDYLDPTDEVVQKAEDRQARVIAETPLRIPSMALNTIDMPYRIYDAIQQPDAVNVEPNEGEYGPKVRRVGALEAFGQAQYGQLSSADVQSEVSSRLRQEIEGGRLQAADESSVRKRAAELADEIKYRERPTRNFIKDTLEDRVSDAVGAPRDEDKTAGERLLQAGLAAVIPNPAPASRAANIATEILLPGVNVKHYGAGAVALNAGISVGAQGAMELATQPTVPGTTMPVVDDADKLKTPYTQIDDGVRAYAAHEPLSGQPYITQDAVDDEDDDATFMERVREALPLHDFTTSATLFTTMMAGLAAAKKPNALTPNVSAPHPITGLMKEATPNVVAEPNRGGVSGKLARQADEFASVERAGKNAGMDNQEAIEMVNEHTHLVNSPAHVDISHWTTTGRLPGSTKVDPYPPRAMMQDHAKSVEMGVDKELNEYLLLKSALRTREKFFRTLNSDAQMYDRMRMSAFQRGDHKAAAEYKMKYDEAQTQMQNVLKDAPPSLSHYSVDEMLRLVKAGDADSFMSSVSKKLAARNKVELEYLKERNAIDDASYNNLMDEVDYYTPVMKDLYDGKTGMAREGAKVKRWLSRSLKEDDPLGEGVAYRNAEGPYAARQMDNGDARVEAPMHWTDAFKQHGEHVIRFAQRNEFKRGIVDDLRAKANPAKLANVMESLDVNGTLHTRKQWDVLFDKVAKNVDKSLYHPIIRGDKVEYVRFKDPIVHHAMGLPPTMSGPVIRLTQMIQRPFKALTTGDVSGYQGMSAFLDTQTIGYTRRIGDVYGLDYLALKGVSFANTLSKRLGGSDLVDLAGNTALTIKTAGRAVDQMTVNMIPYMLNVTTALQTFVKTYGNHIGLALTNDIASRSPFFETIARMFPQAAQQLGTRMTQAYKNSLLNIASEGHVINQPNFRKMRSDMKEAETLFADWGGGRLGGVLAEPWEMWKHAVAAMESSARIGLFMRNVEMDAARLAGGDWRKLPKSIIDKHLRHARTDAGDFGRRVGRAWQKTAAVVPYSGVVMKTMRAGFSRVFDHSDPKTAAYMTTLMMTGAVVPRLQSDWLMTNTNEYLRDYYYNKLADFQREEAIFFPRPRTLHTLWSGDKGKIDALTEKDFYKVSLEQMFRPIASAVSAGLRAVGMYNTSGDVNEQSGFKQFGVGLGQALGLPAPPAWNAVAGTMGLRVNPSAAFELRSPFESNVATAAGRSGAYDALNVSSNISSGIAEFIATLAGPGAARLTQAFDTGWQTLEKDGTHYVDAVVAAFAEFGQRTANSTSRFDVPGLSELDKALQEKTGAKIPFVGAAADRVYSRNSTSETVKTVRELMSVVSGPNNRIGKDGTGIDELDFVIDDIRDFTRNGIHSKSGESYAELSEEWRELNEMVMANDANRGVGFKMRESERIRLTKMMQDITVKQAEMLREMEEQIGKDWGLAYKAKFGVPFTMQDLVKRAGEAKRRGIASRNN